MKRKLLFGFLILMCVSFLPAQELDRKVRDAVYSLAERISRPLDVVIGDMSLEGTKNVTTGFSLYLHTVVKVYAEEISIFRVINTRAPNRQNEAQRGTISGTFAKRGENVEIYLRLVSNSDDVTLSSSRFTVPYAELTRLDIVIEPENLQKITELQTVIDQITEIVNPVENNTDTTTNTNQNINIQAQFNSETRTYFHRDELKMTLTADRNCYFKVIHIDADNQMKMIYPNSYDKNNQLRANRSRTIFETAKYMLYEPYGAETILIVASSEQFANIEQEYIAPWTTATADSVRTAVRGATRSVRGDSTAIIGEAAYTITILKPHDEYEYTRPDNMKEFFENLRRDVTRQRGTFEGNETSGFYILENVRGSYRVSRDKPDSIQFAYYYLDNYTGGENAGTRTRSAGFNFSIRKPQDINQAIHTVRTGIEQNGGIFTGNEQEGNFRAKGIAGLYRVSDLVNVTITEKPFMIPNSMIEREVRSFFAER